MVQCKDVRQYSDFGWGTPQLLFASATPAFISVKYLENSKLDSVKQHSLKKDNE